MTDKNFKLKLKGKTCVFVDWANVYRWKDHLKKEIDIKKLFRFLKTYKEIKEVRFYFGKDVGVKKSINFLKLVKEIGYILIEKEVKYLRVYDDNGIDFVNKRKCDFDLEIGLDSMELVDNYDAFIFFSGDGDYATLYERLIKKKKQIIVVYTYGCLGKEIWEMKKGIFKVAIKKFGFDFYKKMTPTEVGARLK